MKRFTILILAAILGSAITIGTYTVFHNVNKNPFHINQVPNTPISRTAFYENFNGDFVPLEFTAIAKKITPAVVHIKSISTTNIISRPFGDRHDPFWHFFDDDIFKRFFEPRYKVGPDQKQPRSAQKNVVTGSGVIIHTDGYIVTNNHVIDKAKVIEVILEDNRVFKAKLIGSDPSSDIALLQIKEKGLPTIPFGNSNNLEVGEWVLAVGNPFNLQSTVTAGIISAKGRHIDILHDINAIESFIQTDAAVNPGNSGGALVNLQGGLVGVINAIASPTGAYAGYGFAVPSNIVVKVAGDLKKYGMVQRGYLGLVIRNVDGILSEEKKLGVTEGVYVDSITNNSAAGFAGIKVGDVILSVDDVKVKTSAQLLEIIGSRHPGDKLLIDINRNGESMNFIVTLRNKQGKAKLSEKSTANVLNILGIELEELTKEEAGILKIEGGLKITKIYSGKIKQYTVVRPGFIITQIDGVKVTTVKEFNKYFENKKGGVMIKGVYEDYPGYFYYAFGY